MCMCVQPPRRRPTVLSTAAVPFPSADTGIKVFLAEHGTKHDLLNTLAAVQDWAQQQVAENAEIARGYLEGSGPFPERAAQLVLVGKYVADVAEITRRWADWATHLVEEWPHPAAS